MMCILWSVCRYMRAYPLYTHYIYYSNNLIEWKLVKASKFEACKTNGFLIQDQGFETRTVH